MANDIYLIKRKDSKSGETSSIYPIGASLVRTKADWATNNPVLSKGVCGYESDTLKAKVGDGVRAWVELGYVDENKVGLPTGGGLGQALVKKSDVAGDVGWKTLLDCAPEVLTQQEYADMIANGAIDPNRLYCIKGASDNALEITKSSIAVTLGLTIGQLDTVVSFAKLLTINGSAVDINADVTVNGINVG